VTKHVSTEARLRRRIKDLIDEKRTAEYEAIIVLATATEYRDKGTGDHIRSVSQYATLLAVEAKVPKALIVGAAAAMHDVGKVGVPNGVLFKPGKLSASEFELVKQHSQAGYEILSMGHSELLKLGASIALTHHERWDGTGYPHGLAGKHIPLEGRIASVADVFDALLSRRVYKPAFPLEQALQIMADGRGAQFDADIVDLLLAHLDEAVAIQEQYPDVVVPLGHA